NVMQNIVNPVAVYKCLSHFNRAFANINQVNSCVFRQYSHSLRNKQPVPATNLKVSFYVSGILRECVYKEVINMVMVPPQYGRHYEPVHIVLHYVRVVINALIYLFKRGAGVFAGLNELYTFVGYIVYHFQVAVNAIINGSALFFQQGRVFINNVVSYLFVILNGRKGLLKLLSMQRVLLRNFRKNVIHLFTHGQYGFLYNFLWAGTL